jgi:predicted acetyltransferase
LNASPALKIDITPAKVTEKPILRQMMELYQYDFSEFVGADLGPSGIYDYPYLDHYWVDPDRFPFLVRFSSNLAGFVLVSRFNYLTGLKDAWVVSEFFIMRKYRHQGLGEYAAQTIFDQFPGNWQVSQIYENSPATTFWRKVIARYTSGNFQEDAVDNQNWHGIVQFFSSPPARSWGS